MARFDKRTFTVMITLPGTLHCYAAAAGSAHGPYYRVTVPKMLLGLNVKDLRCSFLGSSNKM